MPFLSSEWAHARPHRPPPATLFHTIRTHCQGWGHQAFHLKFLYIVTPVVVFVGLCVGVWFYGTVWLIRFHRSFYLPHSAALPSKHTIIKFSRLSAMTMLKSTDKDKEQQQKQMELGYGCWVWWILVWIYAKDSWKGCDQQIRGELGESEFLKAWNVTFNTFSSSKMEEGCCSKDCYKRSVCL